MDKDYAPLSTACVRALNDKMYDKRKLAALEIEKMVKEFHQLNNHTQIKKLLKVLGHDFAVSKNPQTKKGGLIGLAAIAVGLGKDSSQYTDQLIQPILANFSDADLRVRYFACESLYNVVKVTRTGVLPHFTAIFNALSKLVSDPDPNVKNGSELLDKLLKDIVTESATFDLVSFTPLLRERMYTSNPYARQFIISWISVLNAVPDIKLVQFLPEILDALFLILADKNFEIKKMCESLLNEFLCNIKADPGVDFNSMINILIVHSQSSEELLQFTAITWIKEFVQVSGPDMLTSIAGILMSILPCLSYENEQYKNIKDTARTVNYTLQTLVSEEKDTPSPSIPCAHSKLDVTSVVDVMSKYLIQTPVPTKVACLRWIYHLHSVIPNRFYNHVEELFPILLKVLSDSTDEVIQTGLEVLSQIIASPSHENKGSFDTPGGGDLAPVGVTVNGETNPYFDTFMINLVNMFRTDPRLLSERGSFIIRQLCVLLDAESIYKSIATILLQESELKFLSSMIETLNTILLTSSELYLLRNKLKQLNTKESCDLFKALYHSWTHNPVALIALCLLTQNYQHACDLLRQFGDIEITLDFLTEVDKLVQLIESPIFTYLRLELLDVSQNQHLVQAMFGILMLLPQSEAFRTLRSRLKCIPKIDLGTSPADRPSLSTSKHSQARTALIQEHIDFASLLELFIRVRSQHRDFKTKERVNALLEKGVKNVHL
uniref:Protein VAC14 homolog n=1 Tax=Cacopsylla melanoneura TaxID=428564 RepID=A0A8D8WR57_9HEMI